MTEQEFLEKLIVDTDVKFHREEKEHDYYSYYRELEGKEELSLDDYIYVEWITGGQGGGSCWSDNHFEIKPEPEANFDDLDAILEKVMPHITYLQYKKIGSITKRDSRSCNEYYGNYTVFSNKIIKLRDLFNILNI